MGVAMHLSARETAVLALIAQGFPDRAVARILAISAATARKHRENIQQKLNVGKAALLVWHYFRLNPDELKKSRRSR
jgi:DNA-binding CsgD family transcriptional regulator